MFKNFFERFFDTKYLEVKKKHGQKNATVLFKCFVKKSFVQETFNLGLILKLRDVEIGFELILGNYRRKSFLNRH